MKIRPLFVGVVRLFALPAAAALLLGACAGAGTNQPASVASKPPAVAEKPQLPKLVPTRVPPDLGGVERSAWLQTVQLGDDFAAGNAEAFLAKVSMGFYHGYGTLSSSLKTLLANSSAGAVVVAVRQATKEDERVSVRAEWTRSVTLADGSVDARQGDTVFIYFITGENLRLIDYRGDAPFAIAGI